MTVTSDGQVNSKNWLDQVKWDADGLVPVIAQEVMTKRVLMFAWMNREALQKTVAIGQAVYFSRSRKKLWHKGEQSGHFQNVKDIRLDCDGDVILLKIEQVGAIACHTGRHACFYSSLRDGQWVVTEPVLQDPATIYK
jgi:phosphoribosyl-AMP cyclohydrolase